MDYDKKEYKDFEKGYEVKDNTIFITRSFNKKLLRWNY